MAGVCSADSGELGNLARANISESYLVFFNSASWLLIHGEPYVYQVMGRELYGQDLTLKEYASEKILFRQRLTSLI